jgi:hypothetical protein
MLIRSSGRGKQASEKGVTSMCYTRVCQRDFLGLALKNQDIGGGYKRMNLIIYIYLLHLSCRSSVVSDLRSRPPGGLGGPKRAQNIHGEKWS